MPKNEKVALLASDSLATSLAFFVAYFLRNKGIFRLYLDSVQPVEVYLIVLPIAIFFLIVIFTFMDLYEPKKRLAQTSELIAVFQAVTVWVLLIMAGSYLAKYDYSRIIVLLFYFFSLSFILVGRVLIRGLQRKYLKLGVGVVNISIVGAGRPGREIAKRLQDYSALGYNLIGFFDDYVKGGGVIGKLKDLKRMIKRKSIHQVYISDPTLSHEKILEMVAKCSDTGVKFKIVSNIFSLVTSQVDIADLESIPSLDVSRVHFSFWKRLYKRAFDLFFSLMALFLTTPLWIVVAILIKIDSKGQILFTQKRVGLNEKIFEMYKFRTMIEERQKEKVKSKKYIVPDVSPNDSRVTFVGRFLRRTSLDELPQFINILKGEMSVVGPRPELPEKAKKHKVWQKRRLSVKPGLTGLWQILGRKNLPLSQNLEYDFYYINNQSLFLDIVIILKTIPRVILGKGAY